MIINYSIIQNSSLIKTFIQEYFDSLGATLINAHPASTDAPGNRNQTRVFWVPKRLTDLLYRVFALVQKTFKN